jgi:hypothetical protein
MKSKMGKLPSEIISLNLHFKKGLDNYNYEYFGYVLSLFDAYDRLGILPFNGCFSDQPAKIIEIFNVLDQLKTERQMKLQEEQQRESKKQNRKKR